MTAEDERRKFDRARAHAAGYSVDTLERHKVVVGISSDFITPEMFGCEGDGVADDTSALQAAINWGVANGRALQLTAGKTYKTTSRLQIGTGAAIASFHMYGQPSIANFSPPKIHATSATDMAINIQGARTVVLERFAIGGTNSAPYDQTTVSADLADYVSPGHSNTRWAPHAGITVDAFSGDDPGTGYAGATYGQYSSVGVFIRNMSIEGFVVGFCDFGTAGNGEAIVFEESFVNSTAVTVAVCQTQCTGVVAKNLSSAFTYTHIDSRTYGAQNGRPPKVEGFVGGRSFRCFNVVTTFDVFHVTDFYVEAQLTIGLISGELPALIESSTFFMDAGVLTTYAPLVHGTFATVCTTFKNCNFSTQDAFLNVIGPSLAGADGLGRVSFEGCLVRENSAPPADYFHLARQIAGGYIRISVANSRVASSLPQYISDSVDAGFLQYRTQLGNSTRFLFSSGAAGGNLATDMKVTHAQPKDKSVRVAAGGYAWAGSTLTFNATTDGELRTGDWLFWKVKAASAGGSPNADYNIFDENTGSVVALKITNVAGLVITAVAQGEVSELDTTWAPADVFVAFEDWAPNLALTGTWNNGVNTIQLDQVGFAAHLKVNDFIQAANGLPAIVRVIGIDTGTGIVTLSKNTTAALAAEPLYYSKLVAF